MSYGTVSPPEVLMDEHIVENRGDTGNVWLLASSYSLWALAPDFAQGRCGCRRTAK